MFELSTALDITGKLSQAFTPSILRPPEFSTARCGVRKHKKTSSTHRKSSFVSSVHLWSHTCVYALMILTQTLLGTVFSDTRPQYCTLQTYQAMNNHEPMASYSDTLCYGVVLVDVLSITDMRCDSLLVCELCYNLRYTNPSIDPRFQ